jgi:predicted permease
VERDLDDELQATLDLLVDEKVRGGMRPEEACRAARLELGAIEAIKDEVRDVIVGARMELWLSDVKHSARALRRTPLFTLAAVMSLGIGIAGTAIVFSLADAYLFRNRPGVTAAHTLVEVGRVDSGERGGFYSGDGFDTFSYPNYLDYRERQRVFEDLAAYRPIATFGLGTGDAALRVPGSYVSANFFSVLGVPMALGRGFRPEEERLASPAAVAVISYDLWQAQFDGAGDVIGRSIRVNGRPFTIIGVTARGFNGYTFDLQRLWVPITGYPDGDDLRRVALRGRQWLMGVGRLKQGVAIDQAREEMARIGRDLQREYPGDNRRHGVGVEAAGGVPVSLRSVVSRFVGFLSALVGLILLIAVFNVAGMLLARASGRSGEMGVRMALGAARYRIVRFLVIESLLVSAGGTAAGLAGAWLGIRLLERTIPLLRIPVVFDLGIDWRVIAFSAAVAAITGVAGAVLPARFATRPGLAPTMAAQAGRHTHRLRSRSAFVAAEIALSALLVVCALLLGRSVRNAGDIDPGFSIGGVEAVGLNLQLGGYDAPRGRAFAEALTARVESLPGVEDAAAAFVVPLTGEREGGRCWRPDEFGDDRAIDASQNVVTPGYFRTLGLPLIAGRAFDQSDRAGAPAVAIINETLARTAWPGEIAIGKRLAVGVSRRSIEVVGVVRDAKYRTLGERPTPFFYVPAAQRYESTMWILVRPKAATLIPAVRAVIQQMDPNLPVTEAATLADLTAFTLFPQRLAAWLAALVGMIGVLLATVGVYGVTAYSVSRQTREIGIRVALGALHAQVLRPIVGHALWLAVAGTAAGLVAAALLTRFLEGMLYGIRPLDLTSFAGGAIVLISLAVIASLVSGARAMRVNPVDALRAQ